MQPKPTKMICKEYSEMSIIEKYNYIGKAIHLIQSDQKSHKAMSSMIRAAEQNGLFDEVKILPINKTDLVDGNYPELID